MVIGNYWRRISKPESVVLKQKEEYTVDMFKRDEEIVMERAKHDQEIMKLKSMVWRLKKVVVCLTVVLVVSLLKG